MYARLHDLFDACSAWVEQHELLCCAVAAALLCILLIARAIRFVLRPRKIYSSRRAVTPAIGKVDHAVDVTPGGPMVSPEVFDLAETLASLEASPDSARAQRWEDETVNERPRTHSDRFDRPVSDVATAVYPSCFALTIQEEKRQAHRRPTERGANRWWQRIHPRTIARSSR